MKLLGQAYSEHPLWQAIEHDVSFSINSDDPGPFECSMRSEYEVLLKHGEMSESIFHKIYQNSKQAAFVNGK